MVAFSKMLIAVCLAGASQTAALSNVVRVVEDAEKQKHIGKEEQTERGVKASPQALAEVVSSGEAIPVEMLSEGGEAAVGCGSNTGSGSGTCRGCGTEAECTRTENASKCGWGDGSSDITSSGCKRCFETTLRSDADDTQKTNACTAAGCGGHMMWGGNPVCRDR